MHLGNPGGQASGASDGLAAQIHESDFGDGLAEEVGAEALKFLDRVGGIEGAGGGAGRRGREEGGDQGGSGASGGFGGVNDGHRDKRIRRVGDGFEDALDGGLDERVVSAAEQQGLGLGSAGEGFGEIDFDDVVGDGVIDPAFFDERDEERTGLLMGFETKRAEGVEIGMGLNRGGGGKDEDGAGGGVGDGGLRSGLDDADDRDGERLANVLKG